MLHSNGMIEAFFLNQFQLPQSCSLLSLKTKKKSMNIQRITINHQAHTHSLSRCIKLALVHDMAECIVGDIAPSDNISKVEKHRREEAGDQVLHGNTGSGVTS